MQNQQMAEQLANNQNASDIFQDLVSKGKLVIDEAGDVLVRGVDQINDWPFF